jgi:ribonucleotide reductase beta subunit family protein with ferritin-like domain
MTTLTDAEMHQQSRFWQNEEVRWHSDIRAWEEELTRTLSGCRAPC